MLFCTFEANAIISKTIVYVFETLSEGITSTPNAISNWINKPRMQYTNKQHKTSNDSGKFSQNLCASKKSCYNERNCKSGRHGCRHTFMKHKPQTKRTTTNNLNPYLKIKGRKLGTFKSPPPQRQNCMLRAISRRENRQDINDNAEYILSYDEPDLCNGYISKEQDSVDRFSINFPRHCVLVHVLLDTNPLNDMDSWKEVVRPSKKPRSLDPHRLNPIQTVRKATNNKNMQQKNKKSRSVVIQTPENRSNKNKESRSDNTPGQIKPRSENTPNNPISTISDFQELRRVDKHSTPQRMTSVAGHPKNRLYINNGASLHILFNKELMGELHNI